MRILFAFILASIYCQALADSKVSYKCIMHRHIILMNDIIEEGKLDTFEMREESDELYLSGWYFDGASLPQRL